ncbi:MAG: tetraacyldisaccharide 4'-kinase [Porticoccus sp.]|jgi:tetraacyldisaccharide 4'-kinase
MLEKAWSRNLSWTVLLIPFAWLFRLLAGVRRFYQVRLVPSPPLTVPVVVVGNISVGGTGKTPLVAALAHWLQEQGYHPGVISRGYGGRASQYPLLVTANCSPLSVGDESLLLTKICPVVVDPDRYRAAIFLLEKTSCDLILSDDGLQHYRLPRDIEIAVVDGKRQFGNGQCLPAGPLREPVKRLKDVDFVLTNVTTSDFLEKTNDRKTASLKNSTSFAIEPIQLRQLNSGEVLPVTGFNQPGETWLKDWGYGLQVHAVAGIGSPERFRSTLESLSLDPQLHHWPDHHNFSGEEFAFQDDWPIIITAKDAVKCTHIINDKIWVLDVQAVPDFVFLKSILKRLRELKS